MKTWIKGSTYKSIAILAVLTIGLLSPIPNQTQAQTDTGPAVVIAMAPLNEQFNDIDYLAKAASEDIGQMSGLIRMQATGFLRGIDMDKPMGAFLYFEDAETEPEWLAFVPLKNMDDLLDNIANWADVEEDGDMVTVIPDNGEEIMMRKSGKFVFVSTNEKRLKELPENPQKQLDSMGGYNVGARLFMQRVPEDLRNMMIETIQDGAESGIDDIDDELQAELQRAQVELQMAQMKELILETDELMIGMNADKAGKRIVFDVNMSGKEGSNFEKRITAGKSAGKSSFAGFLMGKTSFNANMCVGMMKNDIDIYLKSMKDTRESVMGKIEDDELDEKEAELATKLTNTLFDAMEETLKEGKLDAGAVIMTDKAINGAIGMRITDPKKVEAAVKEMVASAEGDLKDKDIQFNLNSGSHRGVNMHEIMIQVDNDEDIHDYVGDQIKVILGIGEKEVYVAFGQDPMELLKKAMDASASGETKNALETNLFLAPIMKFAANAADEEMLEKMADTLSEKGNDRVRIAAVYGKRDMKTQFEIQDGILSLIGVAAENLQGMMGGGGGGDF